jgi:triacylglycerol esterase/lipase EstA (alpha/beta hydrolase family)
MATSELAPEQGAQTAEASAPATAHDPVAASSGAALARVKAVRGQGWDAVEQVAAIIKQNPSDQQQVMHWLQQSRGNDFVQHVVAEIDGKSGKATKFPIVMLHGLGAAPASWDAQIPAAMRSDGDAVFEVAAPPFATPQERAKAIAPQLEDILKKTGASKLNLIAWSEGGLDARYLISSMGWADRVASLSMVATPNRGSANADKVAAVMGDTDAVLSHVHAALAQLAGGLQKQATPAKPATLPPTLAPILSKLDDELGGLLGEHPVKLETLITGPANEAAKLKGDLASKAAELARQLLNKVPPSAEPTLQDIARKLGQQDGNPLANTADPHGAMRSLSEKDAPAFNKANPNMPGVYYQSWAGIASPNGKLTPAQLAELRKLGPVNGPNPNAAAPLEAKLIPLHFGAMSQQNGDLNDGTVGVKSAMWGDYQGTVPMDHTDFASQRPDAEKDTGFDAVEFYRKMAEDLAKRGD